MPCIKCYLNFSQLIFYGQNVGKYYFICHEKPRETKQKLDIDWKPSATLWLLSALEH